MPDLEHRDHVPLYDIMKARSRRDLLARFGLAVAAAATPARLDAALAQAAGEDLTSPFGPRDQRGAANRITPAKVLEAIRLVKQGKVYTPSAGGPFGDNNPRAVAPSLRDEVERVRLQAGEGCGEADRPGPVSLRARWRPPRE